jgi:hypothetical protein
MLLKCLIKDQFLSPSIWRTWRRSSAPTVQVEVHHKLIIRKLISSLLRILRVPACGVTIVTNCRDITKFKQQKKAHFEGKSGPRKKSLVFLFEEINALKKQLKPAKDCKKHQEEG